MEHRGGENILEIKETTIDVDNVFLSHFLRLSIRFDITIYRSNHDHLFNQLNSFSSIPSEIIYKWLNDNFLEQTKDYEIWLQSGAFTIMFLDFSKALLFKLTFG